jgi:hypothetical protein
MNHQNQAEINYDALAPHLRTYIFEYVPKGQSKSIDAKRIPVPLIHGTEVKHFIDWFENNNLEKKLEDHVGISGKRSYSGRPYIIEAIRSFFEEGRHKQSR